MKWCATHSLFATLLLLVFLLLAAPPNSRGDAGCALILGGGPDRESNSHQIERHVRFVASLVPTSFELLVLFADGNSAHDSVSFSDSGALSLGRRALGSLFVNDNLDAPAAFRRPDLGSTIDGAARSEDLRAAWKKMRSHLTARPARLFLYAAGHGSKNDDDSGNNSYDFWGGGKLSVRDLARQLAALPPNVPATVVMAQCYSGSFGNLIFKDGVPKKPLVDREIAGFFATVEDREAAGCSPDPDATDEREFTRCFFEANAGHGPSGEKIQSADFDADGHVGMDEAFCYALIHDETINVPVCTSDVFLRQFVELKDADIYKTPLSKVRASATPAQRAALDVLAQELALTGEDALLKAYDWFQFADPLAPPAAVDAYRKTQRALSERRQAMLNELLARWPDLRWPDAGGYERSLKEAEADLTNKAKTSEEILARKREFDRADAEIDRVEARLLRFIRLGDSIVRAGHLATHGPATLRARFNQLREAEARPLFGEPSAAPARQ